MAELDGIAATLRRQRQDLDQQIEDTTIRSNQTVDILSKIEEWRRRVEEIGRKRGDPTVGAQP